ncbi:hypothetical protein [Bradyrhizobium japonicum]|uniref:hypothetical protein n=1 Tax=Bradyrhizobium japonicum TaxID=375 RepID=UPI00200C8072|nr:hypothetical protein [Bradyrhizobium japonicum]
MATLIGLLASTGLRSGEVVRLDRGDVDLTNGGILVRKTKFRKDELWRNLGDDGVRKAAYRGG